MGTHYTARFSVIEARIYTKNMSTYRVDTTCTIRSRTCYHEYYVMSIITVIKQVNSASLTPTGIFIAWNSGA